MSAVEDRLAELGLSVPDVATPAGAYVPALREGNLVFTSGQLPMVSGDLSQTGKVGDGHGLVPADDAKALAQLCALNAIAAVKSVIGDLDKVTRVVKVVGFVASDPSFTRPARRHQRRQRAAGQGVRRRRRPRAVGGRRGGAAARRAGRGGDRRRRRRLTRDGSGWRFATSHRGSSDRRRPSGLPGDGASPSNLGMRRR